MITAMVRSRRGAGGLRLLDPRSDLNQVADLIEDVFAGEIGPAGLAAVRDLRMMSQLGSLVWLMERVNPEFRDSFTGFVWVEDGRVVGNVTLSRVKPDSARWHISNVAVREEYRRRGIGREMVEAAVELARGRGGDWAILQVRQDNGTARRIYEQLGFVGLYGTVELERPAGLELPAAATPLPAGYRAAPWRAEDWRRVYDLALATTSDMERWVRGVDVEEFRRPALLLWAERIGAFFSGGRAWRVAVEQGADLAGAVLARWDGDEGEGTLSFCVRPAQRGALETWLIQAALERLGWRASRVLRADHPADHPAGVAALQAAGFRERRTLLTMRLRL